MTEAEVTQEDLEAELWKDLEDLSVGGSDDDEDAEDAYFEQSFAGFHKKFTVASSRPSSSQPHLEGAAATATGGHGMSGLPGGGAAPPTVDKENEEQLWSAFMQSAQRLEQTVQLDDEVHEIIRAARADSSSVANGETLESPAATADTPRKTHTDPDADATDIVVETDAQRTTDAEQSNADVSGRDHTDDNDHVDDGGERTTPADNASKQDNEVHSATTTMLSPSVASVQQEQRNSAGKKRSGSPQQTSATVVAVDEAKQATIEAERQKRLQSLDNSFASMQQILERQSERDRERQALRAKQMSELEAAAAAEAARAAEKLKDHKRKLEERRTRRAEEERRWEELSRQSAKSIQRIALGWLARVRVQRVRQEKRVYDASTLLQHRCSGWVQRRVAARRRARLHASRALAATEIARCWRGVTARQTARQRLHEARATTCLTRWVRGFVARRKVSRRLVEERVRQRTAAVLISRSWRGLAARRMVRTLRQQREAEEAKAREAAPPFRLPPTQMSAEDVLSVTQRIEKELAFAAAGGGGVLTGESIIQPKQGTSAAPAPAHPQQRKYVVAERNRRALARLMPETTSQRLQLGEAESLIVATQPPRPPLAVTTREEREAGEGKEGKEEREAELGRTERDCHSEEAGIDSCCATSSSAVEEHVMASTAVGRTPSEAMQVLARLDHWQGWFEHWPWSLANSCDSDSLSARVLAAVDEDDSALGESDDSASSTDAAIMSLSRDPTRVRSMRLCVEGLTSLAVLSECTALRALVANVNRLSSLDDLSHCTNLVSLQVKDNCLQTVEGLQHLVHLREVYVDVNQLTSLEPLCALSELEALSAGSNRLAQCPQLASPRLTTLNLMHNRIQHLPLDCFAGTPSLTSLNLARNQLTELHGDAFRHCPALVTLGLNQNRLESLPAPLALPLLRELWLSGNRIAGMAEWVPSAAVALADPQQVECVAWLPCLQTLKLEDNQLVEINAGALLGAPLLEEIDVSFNDLGSIENLAGLVGQTKVRCVRLNDNPVSRAQEQALRQWGARTFAAHFAAQAPLTPSSVQATPPVASEFQFVTSTTTAFGPVNVAERLEQAYDVTAVLAYMPMRSQVPATALFDAALSSTLRTTESMSGRGQRYWSERFQRTCPRCAAMLRPTHNDGYEFVEETQADPHSEPESEPGPEAGADGEANTGERVPAQEEPDIETQDEESQQDADDRYIGTAAHREEVSARGIRAARVVIPGVGSHYECPRCAAVVPRPPVPVACVSGDHVQAFMLRDAVLRDPAQLETILLAQTVDMDGGADAVAEPKQWSPGLIAPLCRLCETVCEEQDLLRTQLRQSGKPGSRALLRLTRAQLARIGRFSARNTTGYTSDEEQNEDEDDVENLGDSLQRYSAAQEQGNLSTSGDESGAQQRLPPTEDATNPASFDSSGFNAGRPGSGSADSHVSDVERVSRPSLSDASYSRPSTADSGPGETQQAARKVQCVFRGFHVRRQLRAALESARYVDNEVDDILNDDTDALDEFWKEAPPELDDDWLGAAATAGPQLQPSALNQVDADDMHAQPVVAGPTTGEGTWHAWGASPDAIDDYAHAGGDLLQAAAASATATHAHAVGSGFAAADATRVSSGYAAPLTDTQFIPAGLPAAATRGAAVGGVVPVPPTAQPRTFTSSSRASSELDSASEAAVSDIPVDAGVARQRKLRERKMAREQEIADEWGFKDSAVAANLLKRQRRFQAAKQRKQKQKQKQRGGRK